MTLTPGSQTFFFERVVAAQGERGFFEVGDLVTGHRNSPADTHDDEMARLVEQVEELVALDLVALVAGTDAFYKLTAKGKKLADKRPWEIRRLKD